MRRLLFMLGALVLATTLLGQGKGKGKGKGKQNGSQSASTVSVIFSDSDRGAIRQWAQQVPPSGLPPGLAKRGELPPGLQKQLQRNGTLPPGLQKKLSPFPPELTQRLAPLPPSCDCERAFVEGRALIVGRGNNFILDIAVIF